MSKQLQKVFNSAEVLLFLGFKLQENNSFMFNS